MAQQQGSSAEGFGASGAGGGPAKKKGGCFKWGLVGCGVLILLLVLLALLAYTQWDRFMNWAGNQMKAAILQSLPEEENRPEAGALIDRFWTAVQEEKIPEAKAQELGTRFRSAFGGGSLTADEAQELLDFMRETLGEAEGAGAGGGVPESGAETEGMPEEGAPGGPGGSPGQTAAGETAGR